MIRLALGFWTVVGAVVSSRGIGCHGAAALCQAAHGHEHAAHIWVLNNGDAVLGAAVYGAALHAVLGVGHGLLISALGQTHALHAHIVAGGVHHDEHVFEAAIFFAHQITQSATSVAVLQNRRGRGFDAQLVL